MKNKVCEKKLLSLILAICMAATSFISVNAAVKNESAVSASTYDSNNNYHCCSYYLNKNDYATRMFSEWQSYMTTAGINRQTRIYAYMKAGETAYFGSSVYESMLFEDGYAYSESTGERIYTSNPSNNAEKQRIFEEVRNTATDDEGKCLGAVVTGCDIAVQFPSGEIRSFDVIKDGKGYIGKRKHEKNGADYLGTGDPNKYQPLSFTAQAEGVYTFSFHSKDGSGLNPESRTAIVDDVNYTENYGPYNHSDYTPNALNDYPGMWDITIVDTKALSGDGTVFAERKSGRVYAKYLAMNSGYFQRYSDIQLHILTSDGITYRVEMNSIDPYGFIFFANNRGLYTNDLNKTSIYHSVYAGSADMSDLSSTGNGCGVTFHSPMTIDTTLNKTYNIFFESPNADLEHILYEKPSVPEIDEEITFHGYNENHAYYKKGGYFTFSVKNASSLTLSIDVSAAIQANASSDEAAISQAAQQYLDEGGTCKISLSGTVVDGKNTFYWNGKDTENKYIPIGDYDDKTIIYELIPKIGEVHFPLLDVEGMGKISADKSSITGGFTISRETEVEFVDDNGEIHYAQSSDPNLVYFNNNPLGYGTINGRDEETDTYSSKWYNLGDGTKTYKVFVDDSGSSVQYSKRFFYNDDKNEYELSPLSYFSPDKDGNPSDTKTVMAFQQKAGDYSAIDTWTYCVLTDQITRQTKTDFVIEDENGFHGTLKGLVFYDTDPDGKYKKTFSSKDFPLGGYTMVATCTQSNSDEVAVGDTFTSVTNSDGIYTFNDLPKGKYKVDFLDSALSGYQKTSYGCTTKNVTALSDSPHSAVKSIKHTTPVYTIDEEKCTEENNYMIEANPIGVNVEKAQYSYTIHKVWEESVSDPRDSVTVTLYAAKKGEDGNVETVGWVRKVALTASSNWEYTVNYLSSEYLYYVVESYFEGDEEIIIGGSDPVAPELQRNEEQFEGITGTIETPQTEGSLYNVTFDYSLNGLNNRYINMTNSTNSYKVYFHMNLKNDEEDYFRVYYPRNSLYHYPDENEIPDDFDPSSLEPYDNDIINGLKDDPENEGNYDNSNASGTQDYKYWLTEDNKIDDFYSIPVKEKNDLLIPTPTNPNGKIFLGWYYEPNYNATGKPIKWMSDTYQKTTHIYAHWLDTGLVEKDNNDKKNTGSNVYGGFDFFGVQIRNYLYDPNYDNGDPYYDYTKSVNGIRFVTTINNEVLQTVNSLNPGGVYDIGSDEYKNVHYNVGTDAIVDTKQEAQNLSYGYLVAKWSNAERFMDYYTQKGIDYDSLEYKSSNTNGVNTNERYIYVSNKELTSSDYNLKTNILDHRNYDNYRIMSYVLKYEKGDIEANKAVKMVLRAYLRYIDANGLVRTFYNDYDGASSKLKGCCTSCNIVTEMIDNFMHDVANDPADNN